MSVQKLVAVYLTVVMAVLGAILVTFGIRGGDATAIVVGGLNLVLSLFTVRLIGGGPTKGVKE